jgi:hypothetical protein
MNLTKAIQHIYPAAQLDIHFTPTMTDEGAKITDWSYHQPKPTDAQLADAWDKIKANSDLLQNLESAYSEFSDGGKWAFGNAYDTVVNHIRRGDIAAAKLTVQMIQIPAEVPGTSSEELATWAAKKTEILALFP